VNAELKNYGVSDRSVRTFGNSATPELLEYLDLLAGPDEQVLLPDGVAENQGRPLLFFVNESRLSRPASEQQTQLSRLRRNLACRGERAYLARILPGELKVVPVSLDYRTPKWKTYYPGTAQASTFFSRLALGEYDGHGEPAAKDAVFAEMFDLLDQGADRLARRIGRTDVLSLIGRALFFRFLQDREVIKEKDANTIAPKVTNLRHCFDDAENASATSSWLDRTFNGDFLRLTDDGRLSFFEDIGRRSKGAVFDVLSSILRRDKPVGVDEYQARFDWGDFDFAHIPIGLLSQVYEKFIWKWEHQGAKETSVHYTPRNIADTLVDEAFDNLPNAHVARVLDPACGAGVFLVLAFRRLYRERWNTSSYRPDTGAIRSILENQLAGFDLSDSALKLSALSLYLTAIELDPEPVPPEKLKFKDLRDRVLFNPRDSLNPGNGLAIGSLASHLDKRFETKFDLVLSNPPWTSVPKKEAKLASQFTKISQDVIRRMSEEQEARDYHNPDNAPDLPFLWKSTEWCKPNGRIAMALPARILLKQEDIPRRARNTLFHLIEVTGIINGSNLSDTNVWPEMQQPFMLLFARNKRPEPGHALRFVTPLYDAVLNQLGEVRVDSKSAQPVETETAAKYPWLWKVLAVGTSLDVDVIRKLTNRGTSLRAYWEQHLKLVSSNGYQIRPNQTQRDASFLRGLPDLNNTDVAGFAIQPKQLDKFTRAKVCWPRKPEVYRAPLALLRESPGTDRERGWALLSFTDVAFNESFHGYSAFGHPEGELLVRYIHLLVHTLLWMHYALLTSPKFGAERRKLYKSDLDDFPIIPLSDLSSKQKQQLLRLSKRLVHPDQTVFPEIDAFFGNLYGLDQLDLEVVSDTVEVGMPYNESRRRACRPPSDKERHVFLQNLESLLLPFFEVIGKQPEIGLLSSQSDDLHSRAPFCLLIVRTRGSGVPQPGDTLHRHILSLADETGATSIIHEVQGGLGIGILNQYRYWTRSRARLLAAEILRDHTTPFEE